MKRVLKIILPLLLAVLILGGSGWFFLYYRADLTAEHYAARGAKAYAAQRYERAVDDYATAFRMDPGNVQYALCLADAYRAVGNYTKVEYTLVRAISENPDSVDLYTDLSRAYVEQDKLLDASKMLSNIADDTVRAALDERRPKAPVIQPESGYYNQHIEVSLSYASGTAYLSIGDEFPAIAAGAYQAPVALPDGESTVTAVVVSDDGLVSTISQAGYTIGGIIEPVTFADPAIESFARQTLEKDADEVIYTNELWTITEMTLPEQTTTITDLSLFLGLEKLSAENFSSFDWSGIGSLTALRTLDLAGCHISSDALTAIGILPVLQSLDLRNCSISTVSPLSDLTTLQTLRLSGNSIGSLTGLEQLTKLEELLLDGNALTAVTSLSKLTNLKTLDVSDNPILSLNPLASCTKLESLSADDCALTDLEVVENFPALTTLSATGNQISSTAPFAACTKLTNLNLSDNALSSLSGLENLTALGTLMVDNNSLTSLPTFSADCTLHDFSASHNQLTSLSGLSKLLYLNNVNVDYNSISSLDALKNCMNLVKINAFANPISNVSVLTNSGVIVNYDPTYNG